ncbi:MAG TPA: hypothetical protein VF530_02745, partial [Planctomycetota bacterium]
DALWIRVEAARDARRSPFDDSELAAELRADPEDERAVHVLLARLAHLERVAPRRRKLASSVAAAAVLLLGVGAWLARDVDAAASPSGVLARADVFTVSVASASPPAPRCARVELAPRRVLTWTLEGETP